MKNIFKIKDVWKAIRRFKKINPEKKYEKQAKFKKGNAMIRKKIFHLALSLGLFMGLSAAPLAGAYTNPDGTTATYDITADPSTSAEYNENYENEGTINVRAGKNGTGEYGAGLFVDGNFVNKGTINTEGKFDKGEKGDNTNRYGAGIAVFNGSFENNGAIKAMATETGNGIWVRDGDFSNYGSIDTTGINDAMGVNAYKNFFNHGDVKATGVNGGIGLNVYYGDLVNGGKITAKGDGDFGFGVFAAGGDLINNGTIETTGINGGIGVYLRYDEKTFEPYNFVNNGTVTVTATATGHGVYIRDGGNFENSATGTVLATSEDGGGYGIVLMPIDKGTRSGDFVNSGTVVANAKTGSSGGIFVKGGNFENGATGTVIATSEDGSGYGIVLVPGDKNTTVGDFVNSGTVIASAKTGGSGGISVQGGGFENAGTLILDGDGTSKWGSIFMVTMDPANPANFTLKEGASLIVKNDGNIAFHTATPGSFEAEEGAKIVVQNASTLGTGASTGGTFISGASSISGLSALNSEGAVFSYTFNDQDGSYNVVRNAYASSLLNGLPRNLVAGLENSFAGKDLPDADDPAAPWLNMLSDIENQASTADVQAAASQYANSHINSYAAPAFGGALRISRISADYFQNNVLDTLPGLEQPAFGQTDSGFSVWLTPFYQKGELDVRGRSDMDEEFYGMTMGMGKTWSNWTLAGGIHLLDSDFDGDRFNADAKGYGFDLALATRLNLGGFAPRLVLSTSYSTHDFDQYRLVHNPTTGQNERYFADYDVDVYTVGVKVDNDFQLSGNMVLRAGLGLDYASADLDNYQESGDYAQSVRGGDYDSLRAQLSLDLDITLIDGFVLTPRAAAFYEFCDTEATLTSTAVGLPGLILAGPDQDPSRASGRAGLALSYHLVEHLDLSASYDYYFGADRTAHEAGLTLGIKF